MFFWWLFLVLTVGFGGFSRFLQWFWWSRAQNHCKNQENHQNSILRDSLNLFLGFYSGFGGFVVFFLWLFLVLTVVWVVSTSKPLQKEKP